MRDKNSTGWSGTKTREQEKLSTSHPWFCLGFRHLGNGKPSVLIWPKAPILLTFAVISIVHLIDGHHLQGGVTRVGGFRV